MNDQVYTCLGEIGGNWSHFRYETIYMWRTCLAKWERLTCHWKYKLIDLMKIIQGVSKKSVISKFITFCVIALVPLTSKENISCDHKIEFICARLSCGKEAMEYMKVIVVYSKDLSFCLWFCFIISSVLACNWRDCHKNNEIYLAELFTVYYLNQPNIFSYTVS